MHTHTGNTRQHEPQLKSSSCSSTIPSHNSRDVILSHNSRNATCLTPIPSHNSRDTFRATTQGIPASRPLKYHQGLVDHAPPTQAIQVLLQQYGLTLHTSCQTQQASRPPSEGHVSPSTFGATTYRCRQAE